MPSTGLTMTSALLRDRPHARTQRAREEVVEAAIGERIGLHRFGHVQSIAAQEDAQERVPDQARLAARDRVDHARQRALRQHVLERRKPAVARADRRYFRHVMRQRSAGSRPRSASACAAPRTAHAARRRDRSGTPTSCDRRCSCRHPSRRVATSTPMRCASSSIVALRCRSRR